MSTSELSSYLNEIGRIPVLTREAQLRHAQRVQRWLKWPEGRDAAPRNVQRAGKRSLDVMVQSNLRLVVSVARRYQNRGLEMQDLIQEGTLGLVRGVELFDPTRGYAFSTYSYWWIRQAITRALHTSTRTIRIPVNAHELLTRIQKLRAQFYLANGRYPDVPEVSAHLGLAPERVRQIMDLSQLTLCGSLDTPATDRGNHIIDLIANDEATVANNPERALQHELTTNFVHDALSQLPEAERYVIEATYLNNRTMREVAQELQMTRSRIATIRASGLKRLRAKAMRMRAGV